ncbi:D-alanyl-D-alanine carboxypeptidase/D-alanyl-D-alanine-endopeptidase (penicillin-binding protein 4) [Pusillimonas noertemannii]|uniref:D-alanyl-D-alanine carboxypeptidase/D-alanyl-D-alanine-endopeptidase (Penicillin-binding protein 4) n=4 Tax=Pusillimonas noertemannii TaxID=305977 RepID=A0A2U1CR70_9BURK|nr:D-alanyl-D-alanine carboxypeptidase/D-alanyl-D-alanine-endopeptidase (penicillin-binding protein 4) [Pusillimonas noertemannii]
MLVFFLRYPANLFQSMMTLSAFSEHSSAPRRRAGLFRRLAQHAGLKSLARVSGRPASALAGFLFVCLASYGAAASAQALPPELDQAWRAARLQQGDVSLVVQEIGGPRLVELNPATPRNPASVMKMVTTWAALSGLGPEYRWRTELLAERGARIDGQGSLRGPLYIKAGGDPHLTQEELWFLLRELRLRGVKNLSEVVVDRSVFGQVGIDPNAFDDAGDRPYNASPDAMMVGLGAARLLFVPDTVGRKWIPVLDPPLPGVRIQGEVKYSDAVCPGSPAVSVQARQVGAETLVDVAGTAAGSCGEFTVYRLVQSQPAYFSALFRQLWRDLGGTLARGVREGRAPGNAQVLAWTESETLADTIRQINKQSNNVMARTLLLTLGAEKAGRPATPAGGGQAVLAVLAEQGVDTRGWQIDNGSGLSRNGRLTAGGLAGMLEAAWRSPLMPEYVSSLAISGVDGTMRRRLRQDEVRGMAHLKTGTLRDARALAGYVLGASGKRYIVVSLANGERATAIRSFDDALISWLAAR